MPIDPSIPLSVKPAEFMSPAQMISLRNVVRAGQLQQLQLTEATRQMQQQAAIRQRLAQPGATDPQTGMIALPAISDITAIDPQLGTSMAASRARLQGVQAEYADKRAAALKEGGRAVVQAYDEALKQSGGNAEKALKVAQGEQNKIIDDMKSDGRWNSLGFNDNFEKTLRTSLNSPENIEQMRSHYFTPQELAKGSEAPKTRKITQGLTEIDQEWDPASKTWKEVGRGPKAPGTVISMQPPPGQQAVSKLSDQEMRDMNWDDFAKLQKSPISGNALHLASMDLFLTGKMPSLGFAGRGAAGNARLAVMEGRAKIAAELGVTPEEAVTMPEKWKSNARALAHLTTDLNTFEPYVKMLHTNADIAIQLGQKIQQTTPAIVNRPLNWLRMNMGSNPDVAEYLAQMRIVQTEAARALNNPRIVGQLTDEARKEIDQVLSGNAPIAVTERVLRRLQQDGTNRFTKMREQQGQILSEMRGQGSAEPQTPSGKTVHWNDLK